MAARPAVQHRKRGLPFGGAAGMGDAAVHRQVVGVLHQGVADIAKLGRLAAALVVLPCLGIGPARVRLVRALLLVEVALGIAAKSHIAVPRRQTTASHF